MQTITRAARSSAVRGAIQRHAIPQQQTRLVSSTLASLNSLVGGPSVSYPSYYTTPLSTSTSTSSTSCPFALGFAAPTGARGFAGAAQVSGNVGDVIPFPLADIGEGIAECEVLKWFIKEGDIIKQFDKVCEVSSDKANVEITSRYDGVVEKLMYNVGDMAAVGKPLFMIRLTTATANATAATKSADASPAPSSPSTSTTSAPCPRSTSSSSSSASGISHPSILPVPRPNNEVLASPVVRRLASEHGVELGRVAPTGTKGQITKEDVLAYIDAIKGGAVAPSSSTSSPSPMEALLGTAPVVSTSSVSFASSSSAPPAPAPIGIPHRATTSAPSDVDVPITGIQRVMVKTMTAAALIPTFGFADEICMDNLVKLRKKILPAAQKHNIKPSYFAFILKAMSLALSRHPSINAHVNSDCTSVKLKGSHNIGVAMDTPRGLLVPNIKNVQNLSVLEIAAELQRLQALGKEGKLGQADLTGGTITLSNIGTIGGTYCRPVLVVPEVCIGAIGKMTTVAAFDSQGNVYPSQVMHIGWTADHRVLDGASIARFSNEMKQFIENPESMMLY